MEQEKIDRGKKGEGLACGYLEQNGFQVVKRNFRYGSAGEIDIIALEGETIVFVEVKLRASSKYGEPEEAITRNKIAQVRKIAAAYLYQENIRDKYCRFDVIAIRDYPGQEPDIIHYKDAF